LFERDFTLTFLLLKEISFFLDWLNFVNMNAPYLLAHIIVGPSILVLMSMVTYLKVLLFRDESKELLFTKDFTRYKKEKKSAEPNIYPWG
jgi:hypothetical protein